MPKKAHQTFQKSHFFLSKSKKHFRKEEICDFLSEIALSFSALHILYLALCACTLTLHPLQKFQTYFLKVVHAYRLALCI